MSALCRADHVRSLGFAKSFGDLDRGAPSGPAALRQGVHFREVLACKHGRAHIRMALPRGKMQRRAAR